MNSPAVVSTSLDGKTTLLSINGYTTLVDTEDVPKIADVVWYTLLAGKGVYFHSPSMHTSLHRTVLGLVKGDKKEVDHKNGNPLDNRKENLRVSTSSENKQNRGPYACNKSGLKGVHWSSRINRWRAKIAANSRVIYLGCFLTKEEAYTAYCEAAKKYHGEFARLA